MYQTHWGLAETPFRSGRSTYFYQSPAHEEALARLEFLISQGRSVGLLLGEEGCGKTTLFTRFANQLVSRRDDAVVVSALGTSPREFCWHVAAGFGLNPKMEEPQFSLWRKITDRLTQNRYQKRRTVLLVDNAADASPELQTLLLQWLHVAAVGGNELTLVLAVSPRQTGRLSSRLASLVDLRIELDSWNEDDTQLFVSQSLSAAGRTSRLFDETALARLHALSQGSPRKISRLAELALAAGAGQGLDSIDGDTIDAVQAELEMQWS